MHWTRRGPDESTSDFGQWFHDELGNWFWAMDDDIRPGHWTFGKRETHIFREIEQKWRHQKLSRGEYELLTLQARGIQHLIDDGWVSPFSGAFVVYTDPPFISASVERIDPNGAMSMPIRLSGDQVETFVGCRG